MDRDRLKEVHKTETTESRVNEDFVDWLKNKGPTWLMIALIALTAYLGLVRWRTSTEQTHNRAWIALAEAEESALPASFESVADEFPRVDSIAQVARLMAAQRLLESVHRNQPLGAIEGEDETLSEAEREQNLSRADRHYQAILDADDGSRGMALHALNALNGRAAVAEARGDIDAAQQYYNSAAQRVEAVYPALAKQARTRAEHVQRIAMDVALPGDDDVQTPRQIDVDRQPAAIDPSLEDLLNL